MTSLSDILNAGGGGDLRDLWNTTDAAGEMGPLPPGEYLADIVNGELETSRTKSTPGFKMTFAVVEPVEFAGRRFWHDCWLTAAALPQTKRDLAKIGVQSLDQLEKPLQARIRCRVKLALRRDDNGDERNRLKTFEVVGIVRPERDAFAPDGLATDEPEAGDIDTICPKCRKPIDGAYGGCLACDLDAEAATDDFF
jgi:hypothetical protein